MQLGAKIQRDLDRKLSTHGIGVSEFLVLKTLAEHEQSFSQVALADSLQLSPSGVARLINPMEKLHLVEKQKLPRDARMSMVSISETGKQIYRDALVTFEDFCDAAQTFLAI